MAAIVQSVRRPTFFCVPFLLRLCCSSSLGFTLICHNLLFMGSPFVEQWVGSTTTYTQLILLCAPDEAGEYMVFPCQCKHMHFGCFGPRLRVTKQHGYERTVWWFEGMRALDVFDEYLAEMIASAADRPVRVLEVRENCQPEVPLFCKNKRTLHGKTVVRCAISIADYAKRHMCRMSLIMTSAVSRKKTLFFHRKTRVL